MNAPQSRKEIATAFLTLASSGNVQEAFERYIHPDFIHHLVFFEGDRESFLQAMEENARAFPSKSYETMHALEDGAFVAVHGKVTLAPKIFGVIHIFRFEEDKIIESWEASQEALEDSPNEHGLFLGCPQNQQNNLDPTMLQMKKIIIADLEKAAKEKNEKASAIDIFIFGWRDASSGWSGGRHRWRI